MLQVSLAKVAECGVILGSRSSFSYIIPWVWSRSRQLPSRMDIMPILRNILRNLVLMFLLATAGCTSTQQFVDRASLLTPLQIHLGEEDSPLGPVRIRSGQMISRPHCCPPVELRDAKGRRIRELNYTRASQALVAAPGTYSIVGHDPAGGESVLFVEVTKN